MNCITHILQLIFIGWLDKAVFDVRRNVRCKYCKNDNYGFLVLQVTIILLWMFGNVALICGPNLYSFRVHSSGVPSGRRCWTAKVPYQAATRSNYRSSHIMVIITKDQARSSERGNIYVWGVWWRAVGEWLLGGIKANLMIIRCVNNNLIIKNSVQY
jgi:hypothetical protein